jgi:thiol:disulfide interchange protein DsbA
MKSNMFLRALAVFAFALTIFTSPLALGAQEAPTAKYKTIDPAQRTEPGKIEVLEFFAYSCPHCAVLDPMLHVWAKTLASDVVVTQVPVVFSAAYKPLAQLYYSLEALNRLDLHPQVFKAIHEEHKRVFTKSEMSDWMVTQGVDKAKFEAVFDSFGVLSKTERATQLSKAYNVEGTPSMAVAGKYLTSPSEAGGYQQTIDVADSLVKKVRAN